MTSQPANVTAALEERTPAGTSINFDAQALHDADEEEYQREEQERENELRALLTNAFDDLSDDDDEDQANTSRQSRDLSQRVPFSADKEIADEPSKDLNESWGTHPQPLPPAPNPAWPAQFNPTTSTPFNHAPALQTPSYPTQYLPFHAQQTNAGDAYPHAPPNSHQWQAEFDFGERGEVEGANEEELKFYDPQDLHVQFPTHDHHGYQAFHDNQKYMNPYQEEKPEYYADFQPPQLLAPQDPVMGSNTNNLQNPTSNGGLETNSDLMRTWPPKSAVAEPQVSPRNLDNYRVSYKGVDKSDKQEVEIPQEKAEGYQKYQKEFNQQSGSSLERQMTQLRILYDARGKRIEELSTELETLREERERDVRILKHKLTLAEDERRGHLTSLEQSQNLLSDAKIRENDLLGKMSALESQIQSLASAKEELINKLQISESTIESLNMQLMQMGSNESLTRSRQQHDSIISSLHQKHAQEIHLLNSQLDATEAKVNSKDDEIDHLRRQLAESQRAGENARIDRGDVVNRLTRSLEESQRQCQDLLDSGATHELSRTKLNLQEAIASKSIMQDLNSALQDEVQDLKEQVRMYESASNLGVLPGNHSTSNGRRFQQNMDDSYSQLAIKNVARGNLLSSATNTPENNQTELSSIHGEDSISGLKTELERCLAMYSKKRSLVEKLQLELSEAKNALEQTTLQLNHAEKSNKERLRKMESSHVSDGLHVDKVIKDRDELCGEVEELKKRLQEVSTNEEKVTAMNEELSSHMSAMVQELDEDKRIALEKCQESLQRHYEERKQILRQEFSDQYAKNLEEVTCALNTQIEALREELSISQREIDETKELYVRVCEEKDTIEDTLNAQWHAKLKRDIEKITQEMNEEKREELEIMRQSCEKEFEIEKIGLKEEMNKEFKEEMKVAFEAKIAEERVKWLQESESSKNHWKKSKEELLAAGKKDWQVEKTQAMEEEFQARLEQAKTEWMKELSVTPVAEKLKRDLSQAIEAKERIEAEMKVLNAQKDQQRKDAVAEVQEQCENDYRQFLQEHQDTLNKALKSARLQFAQEKADMETRHKVELDNAQKGKEISARLSSPSPDEEKENLKEQVEALKDLHEAEKIAMAEQHRENLMKALEESEELWQKKLESTLLESGETTLLQREREWTEERRKYKATIKQHEEVMQRADAHMEAEIQKLHSQVSQQCQEQLEQHMRTLEEDYEEKLKSSAQEVEKLVTQIEAMHADIQKMHSKYAKDVKNLSGKLELAEQNLQKLKAVMDQHKEEREELRNRLQKTEKQRKEVASAYQEAEQEHVKIVTSYKGKLNELNERVLRTEKHLRQMESRAKRQLQVITESLEREHLSAIENLKAQFMEQHKEDVEKRESEKVCYEEAKAELEERAKVIREELKEAKEELAKKEVELRNEKRQRTSTPTQTDDLESSQNSAVDKLRLQYMEAVNKIRDDVLRHVQESNDKAAATVREEIVRERQNTARRLRKYYMRCLDKVLTSDDAGNKAEKLAAMRKHLDNVPEKDSSSSNSSNGQSRTQGSCTPTPEGPVTPRSSGQVIRPVSLGLPEEMGYDNVSNWVSTKGHRSATTQHQSTPKSALPMAVQLQEAHAVSPGAQSDPWHCWSRDNVSTPTPETPGFRRDSDAFKTSPTPSDAISKGTLGYADSTSTPALNLSQAGAASATNRADWLGSTESLSAIDFGSKEIRPKPSSIKNPVPSATLPSYKYTSLRQRLSGRAESPAVPKSKTFPQFNPSTDLNKPFQPVLPRRTEGTNLHRPTPLMTRETQAPSPVQFRSQFQ